MPSLNAVVYGPCEWRQVPDGRARVADLTVAARVYARCAMAVCGVAGKGA